MDRQRFDELTRSLARGTSRRSVLKGLAGGAMGVVGLGVLQQSAMAAPCPAQNATQCSRVDGTFDAAAGTCTVVESPGGSFPSPCNPNWSLITSASSVVYSGSGANCQVTPVGGEITGCQNRGGESHPISHNQCLGCLA